MDPTGARRRYHHGNLPSALVRAAVALARLHGPEGIVLREVARRVGVSPTAAYRHFDSQARLVAAVARVALDELADAMLAEVESLPRRRNPARTALARFQATGRAYVHFAVAQPGLFRTVFSRCEDTGLVLDGMSAPYRLLCETLDECVRTRALPSENRPGADQFAWIGVHGLATLAVEGVLSSTDDAFEGRVDHTLDLIARGIGFVLDAHQRSTPSR